MYNEFGGTLSNLALAKHRKSRAINAENPRGEKGKGGMAASDLGPSRKGSPCLNDIASGQTVHWQKSRDLAQSIISGSQWMRKPQTQIALY